MASDQTVSARAILAAVMEIRRRGSTAALQELEQVEPDLAEHLMESLTVVHQQLLNLHAPPKQTRRLYQDVEYLCLVAVVALRKAHHDLWQQNHEPPKPPDSPGAPRPLNESDSDTSD